MMRVFSLLVLLSLTAACARHPAPAAPAPAPPDAPTEAPPAPPTLSPHVDAARYCILRNGRLESVEVQISFKGDTVWRGTPIAQAFPADSTYALNAAWYRDSEPITIGGLRYVKYGLPRILSTTDVVPVAAYHGVTVFAESGRDPRRPEVVYIPVRPDCEFQPYTGGGIK